MKPFEIHPYRKEYREQLIQIWEDAVRATHDFLSLSDFLEIKEVVSKLDFDELEVFCAVNQGEVAGFIGIADHKIEMLFVDPEYFGKGHGLNLVQYAVNEEHAYQVDVNEQNLKALNFYRKFGFEVVERTEKDDLGMDYPILRMKL
ncbi:putative N-acetyltransferase YjaB [compost metagenome]